MIRFWGILVSFVLILAGSVPARAQNSFLELDPIQGPVLLDWRNPTYSLTFRLPPNPGPASLTLKAKPGALAPANGGSFLLSINRQPAIPFAPVVQGFSARFDVPAHQLRSGANLIEIAYVPGAGRSCLLEQDGSWQINMRASRLDLALGNPNPKMYQLSDWLRADIGAPQSIFIKQGNLSTESYAEFGALVTQALSLQMNEVPHYAPKASQADLVIEPMVSAHGEAGIWLTAQTDRPTLRLVGTSHRQVLQSARWLAQNKMPERNLAGPSAIWPQNPLARPDPWQSLIKNLQQPSWAPRPRNVNFRLPKPVSARVLIDIERPATAGRKSILQVFTDQKMRATPSLWRRVNSVAVDLPARKSSLHQLAIAPILEPAFAHNSCQGAESFQASKINKIALQLTGTAGLSALDRLAWNGGVLAKTHGLGTQIILPENDSAALAQSWRLLGRLAQINGTSMARAQYGGQMRNDLHGMIIGTRQQFPTTLLQALPASFTKGAGTAPGDPYPIYKRPRIIQSAFAAEPGMPAMGIAGSTRLPNGKTWIAISADRDSELASALQDLTNGKALDQFTGTVVRWRGNKVEVNATSRSMNHPLPGRKFPLWQVFLLILVPSGLWSTIRLIREQRKQRFIQS
jgi:hypothetical protein